MTCKYCSRTVPDESIYCMFCGERLARKKREKKKEPKYPKYRVLSDGTLLGQIMLAGKRETVKAANETEYRAKIDGYRARLLEIKDHPERQTLKEIVREYIDENDGVLSPATIRGYETVYANRFKKYMPLEASRIAYQRMINEEAKEISPKTLKNAWALVCAAYRAKKIPVPDVNLPMVQPSDGDFLDYEQITKFLAAIRGDAAELAALLMLHSLRISEALKLTRADISGDTIHVSGAVVPNKDHQLVEKPTNKNKTSRRDVPVVIPRLTEILPEEGKLITIHPSTIRTHIEKACKKAGVPVCSPHDLRRSFASLCYHLGWTEKAIMLVGGWDTMETVHKVYVKLSQSEIQKDIQSMRNYYGFTTGSKKSTE